MILRRFVSLSPFLDQFTLWIHSKYSTVWNSHLHVGIYILQEARTNARTLLFLSVIYWKAYSKTVSEKKQTNKQTSQK